MQIVKRRSDRCNTLPAGHTGKPNKGRKMSEEQAAQESVESAPTTDQQAAEAAESAPANEQAAQVEESAPSTPEISETQKRINQLTREKYEAQRRAQETEQRLQQLEAQAQQAPAAVADDAPTLEKFDYDEEKYQAALVQHQVAKQMQQLQQQQQQQVQLAEQQKQVQSYNDRVNAFAADKPDFTDSVANMPLQNSAAIEGIMALENGPAVAYHLSKNLDVVDNLNRMSPVQAAIEIGKIEAKLSATPAPKTTKAPDPIEPVASGGTVSKSVAEMSVAELIEHEAAKKRAQGA